ncbi:MAG: Inner membrane transport permease YbhR [Lentisphaerae bacterium ADurb.Bin242]|nr:MAG: Inner membrane transport permease YbhR [Lentisphaerae bacterium ADurb.Bin242]
MNTVRRMRALLHKELIQLLKNPKTRWTLFVPPIIQLVVLGYAATMYLKEVRFAVLDHCRSEASRQLIAKFSGNRIFRRQSPLRSEKEMAERISNRDLKLALVIPEDFERALAGRAAPEVQVIVDGRNSSSAGLAIGYAQSILDAFNRDRVPSSTAIQIRSRAWYNPNFEATYFMLPALLAVISLLDILMLATMSLAKEREEGTFDQLLLTPFSSGEILAGKALSTMFVGLCQLTTGVLVIRFWYQIPFMSSYFLLYGLFFSFLFSSIGIGLLNSVLSKNLQQGMLTVFTVSIPFATLSGMATPIESMPDFLQTVTLINPIRHGVTALQRIFLEGAGFTDIWETFVILWVIGVFMFTAAYLLFEHQRKN